MSNSNTKDASEQRSDRKRKWGLAALCLSVVGISFSYLFTTQSINPIYWSRDSYRDRACRQQLKSIYQAFQLYAQDYGDHLPPTRIGGTQVSGWLSPGTLSSSLPVGWADAVQRGSGGVSMFYCPASPNPPVGKPSKSGYVDYWMNTNLSGQMTAKLTVPASTLFLGEGNDGTDATDATYSKRAMPPLWLSDENSPAYRHLDGANYLMADGSVHWLKPDEVISFGGRKNSFALQ